MVIDIFSYKMLFKQRIDGSKGDELHRTAESERVSLGGDKEGICFGRGIVNANAVGNARGVCLACCREFSEASMAEGVGTRKNGET